MICRRGSGCLGNQAAHGCMVAAVADAAAAAVGAVTARGWVPVWELAVAGRVGLVSATGLQSGRRGPVFAAASMG